LLSDLAFDLSFGIFGFPFEYIFTQLLIFNFYRLLFKHRYYFGQPYLFHTLMYFLDQITKEACDVVGYHQEYQDYEAPARPLPPDSVMLITLPCFTEAIQRQDTS
jgi:hypothetical protein